MEQREKVEDECKKLQALIDLETSKTSFIWQCDSNSVNIIPDIFRKSKRIGEPEPEVIENQIDESNDSDSSKSEEQEDDVPDNSVIPHNSGVHQIYIQKIGGKKHVTPEKVVPKNCIVLEVEGNQSPPSFVPYSVIVSGEHSTPEDVRGSQTPEHLSWGSESPKTPWPQQREHHLLVPLNSDPIHLPNIFFNFTGKGLFFLFIILYIFYILVTYSTDGNLPIEWFQLEEQLLTGTLPSQIYKMLGYDFYCSFEQRILLSHYYYMKVTYNLDDTKIYQTGEMNREFIPK
jgi:hypothetical protein